MNFNAVNIGYFKTGARTDVARILDHGSSP